MNTPKILVIVGPTASGKTNLSIGLAEALHGEIISADSRQVYRGLDLGTGKVTQEEMHGIPHHLLDIRDPSETYTAHDFVRDADRAIEDIANHNRIPIVVGGTFLYIDMLLGSKTAPNVPPNEELRALLETLDTQTLAARLTALDPARAATIDHYNRRRLIRALEIIDTLGTVPAATPTRRYTALKIGISISKEVLESNIHARLTARVKNGMIEEVEQLHKNGLSYARMEDLGLEYRYITRYLQGNLAFDEMLEELEAKIRQYAKRQMTWLKRDTEIVWITPDERTRAIDTVQRFLARHD